MWSTVGQGIVINEKGRIIGILHRVAAGKTTTAMMVRVSATGVELVQGEKRISTLRFEAKRGY